MKKVPLSPQIEQAVSLLFAPPDQEQVRAILLEQCGVNIPMWKSAGIERLRCAVLKLSNGNFHDLQSAINLAQIDFRDVLIAAGFGDPGSFASWLPDKKW